MLTRRDLLFTTIAASLLHFSSTPGIELIPEPTLLSEESTRGFRLLIGNGPSTTNRLGILILPGACNFDRPRLTSLRRQASLGSWIVLESGLCFSSREQIARQASLLSEYFGISVDLAPQRPGPLYLAYQWPQTHLIRSFGATMKVRCQPENAIATFESDPVCSIQRVGRGGIVFLSSMLGPSLVGEDPEAHQLCRAIIHQLSLRCAGRLSGDKATTA